MDPQPELPIGDPAGTAPVWCADCGRRLKGRASQARRRGQTCHRKHHPPAPDIRRSPDHHVDQEQIPGT